MNKIIITTLLYTIISIELLAQAREIFKSSNSNLLWQDQAYTATELKAYKNDINKNKVGDWNYAMRYCQDLIIDKYKNWRLPQKDELLKSYQDKYSFKHTNKHSYWSSTLSSIDDSKYYAIYFRTGEEAIFDGVVHYYIRCVHSVE